VETPIFELKDVLVSKYGEEGAKLIYELADQGGEATALRYDLTVPFARYMAQNGLQHLKRFSIGPVFRRDQPAIAKGRYRQFYQCDFDIAGEVDRPMGDAECLAVVGSIFNALDLPPVTIKVNHRGLLEAMFTLCKIDLEQVGFAAVCSAIDKLDKEPWCAVRSEMVNEKGVPEEAADALEPLVARNGPLLETLRAWRDEGVFTGAEQGVAALDEMIAMAEYLEVLLPGSDKVKMQADLSLARGLDYYTGVIFEATVDPSLGVGSIAGGGRYDNLIGMFSGRQVPSVGFALGIERIFTLIGSRTTVRESPTLVYVAAIGDNLVRDRLQIVADLCAADIPAETLLKPNPKIQTQLKKAQTLGAPVAIIIGVDELAAGVVKVKALGVDDASPLKEQEVPRNKMVETVRNVLAALKE
jgi:histidyl-tRNA synthetase